MMKILKLLTKASRDITHIKTFLEVVNDKEYIDSKVNLDCAVGGDTIFTNIS